MSTVKTSNVKTRGRKPKGDKPGSRGRAFNFSKVYRGKKDSIK
jgi:hypothetical protein